MLRRTPALLRPQGSSAIIAPTGISYLSHQSISRPPFHPSSRTLSSTSDNSSPSPKPPPTHTTVLPKRTKTFDQYDNLPLPPTTTPADAKLKAAHEATAAQDQAAAKVYEGIDGEVHPDVKGVEEKGDGDSGYRVPEEMLVSSIPGPKALTIKGVVFDTKGHVAQLDQEFQRAQICSENTLQPRDLRKLDSSLSDQSQVILVREKAILVNLAHVRALIRADRVIVVQSPHDNADTAEHQSTFIYELQGKLQVPKDATVFEIKVMESVLTSVSYGLQQDLHVLESQATQALSALDESVETDKLNQLLLLRRSYNKFMQRVEGYRSAVNELLNNDDDLAAMYLTDKANGVHRAVSDHMEMELMLEHYAKIGDELIRRIQETTANLQTTQHMIGISLDNTRNQLIVFDLQANLATVSLTTSALIASLLGMNLPNHLEGLPWIFPVVAMGSMVVARVVYYGTMRRVGQITKWKGGFSEMRNGTRDC
ncbi:magnesium ion transporter [Podochytrium sp. JEL0797]|nr:magnesium ion transporter [Podochytrium sp. JEL0797]